MIFRVVLLVCLVASAFACIGQQTEDAIKGSGLIFDPYYYMNVMGFSNVETSLYHWWWNGFYVGRQGNTIFNVDEYKQIYPELAGYNAPEAFRHFVECGYYEGRVGLWSLYCGNNNGGCHPSTTCTNAYAGRTCGPCPPGYTGDGTGSCPPETPATSNLLSTYVYNYEFYVTANADLAGMSQESAAAHWVQTGVDEGRQAISSFNVNQYKQIYADVAPLSNRDAVTHYINNNYNRVGLWAWFCGNGNNGGCDAHVLCENIFGASAPSCGQCPWPEWSGNGNTPGGCYPTFVYDYRIFSYSYYISANGDLAGMSEDQAKSHWLVAGMAEGRKAIEGFAVQDYKRIYPDVAALSNFDAIKHYIDTGYTEKRVGVWDWWCGNGANGGCDALVTCTNTFTGMAPWCGMCPAGYTGTGSTPGSCRPTFQSDTKAFSYSYYIAKYPELASYTQEAAEEHWQNTGIPEGRQAIASFSVNEYKQIYPDVAGLSNFDAIGHYVRTGYAENRVGIWNWWCGNGANGGCDALVTCSNTWAGSAPWCGMCPAGYTGSGSTPGSCRPTFPTDMKVFSQSYYVAKYPELAGYSYSASEEHWFNTGIPEGRQATATFSVNEYKQMYPDVAGLSNLDAVGHYVRTGYAENRAGTLSNWCGDGNNGGCDPLTTCTLSWGTKRCGWCPEGYYPGTGETPCRPW